jgi:hypothetical protein
MEYPTFLAILAVVGFFLWLRRRPRALFVIRIRNGLAAATRGTVPHPFLAEVESICRRHGVRHGVLHGLPENREIRLRFSRSFSPSCQQQLRNLWGVAGWSLRPQGRR